MIIEGPKCCNKGIRGYGNPSEGVVIVGIAPGRDEIKAAKPFVGPTGKLMDATLEAAGWSRDKCYCTNVCCWWNDEPDDTDIATCHPRFYDEIMSLGPKLIIPLGAIATRVMLNEKKIGRVRGCPLWVGKWESYVMPTYHPAAILHGSYDFVYDILRDFAKIPTILEGKKLDPIKYAVVKTTDEAQHVLDSLPLDRPIALDIETTLPSVEQTDPFEGTILCLAIGDSQVAYVLPKEVLQGLRWPEDVKWLYHNGMFDTARIEQELGIKLPIVEDTMLLSYALDERQGVHGLKHLAREYCQAGFWEQEKEADLFKYNAHDAVNTCRLYNVLNQKAIDDNVRGMYSDLLIPAANMLRDVQVRGVAIDQEQIKVLAVEWLPKLINMERALIEQADIYGMQNFNPRSPKQLSTLLFNILGLPGGPSTAKEVLDQLEHPYVDALKEFRELEHMCSSYLLGINDDIKQDGRLHPFPFIHGTRTGRLSYRNPPIQTIPQDYSVHDLAKLRRMFIPSDDDHVILEADYSQIEIWIAQGLSQDQNMLADLTEPWHGGQANYHSRVAESILGGDPDRMPKDMWGAVRYNAKKVTFGVMYMEGEYGLSKPYKGIGCTVQQARVHIYNWYKRYSEFQQWQKNVIKEVRETGELQTPFGRKRRIPLTIDHRQDRQAANSPIQSIASDYALTSAIVLHELLKQYDSYIMFLVHDSIVMDVAKAHFSEVMKLVKRVMESRKVPGLPIVPIEMKAGPNWFDVKPCG